MNERDEFFKNAVEVCKKNKTWCPSCEFEIKEGFTKGSCRARDVNGLTPNQCLYGNKF